MNYLDVPEEEQLKFLEDVAKKHGFTDKTLIILKLRFNPNNSEQINATLRKQVWESEDKNAEIINPEQAFQDRLKKIITKLSEQGKFEVNTDRGRSCKGKEPWRIAFEWLWETEFPEWWEQQQKSDRSFSMTQINNDDSKGFQTRVEPGAIAYIGEVQVNNHNS